MLCLGNLVKFIPIYSVLLININADINDKSFNTAEEIYQIRKKHIDIIWNQTDEAAKEIKTLFGTASSKYDLLQQIDYIMTWWSTDVRKRQDLAFVKLAQILPSPTQKDDLEKLKEEYIEGLDFAQKFWNAKIENKMKNIRENVEELKSHKEEPHTKPIYYTLSPELKQIYRDHMQNLTSIALITEAIISAYYSNIKPHGLPEENNKTFITYKSQFDMIHSKMTVDKIKNIYSKRKMVTDRLDNEWKKEGKQGPSQEVFDTEYTNFFTYLTNIVNNLHKSYNDEFESYSNE